MKHQVINELHRFDIRDQWWHMELTEEQELRVLVSESNFGLYADGKAVSKMLVTFRGFRMNWANTTQNNEDVPLSFEEAMKLWQSDDFFVFAYNLEGNSCEICGKGSVDVIAMDFSFGEAVVEWEDEARTFEGTLTRI